MWPRERRMVRGTWERWMTHWLGIEKGQGPARPIMYVSTCILTFSHTHTVYTNSHMLSHP